MMNVSHYRTCGDASCILLNLMSDRAIGQALCWNMHVQTHGWSLCVSVRWSLLVCRFLARISCNVEQILCIWLCEISAIMQKELCTILAPDVKAISWLQNRWIVRHMRMLYISFFRPDSTIIWDCHEVCSLQMRDWRKTEQERLQQLIRSSS